MNDMKKGTEKQQKRNEMEQAHTAEALCAETLRCATLSLETVMGKLMVTYRMTAVYGKENAYLVTVASPTDCATEVLSEKRELAEELFSRLMDFEVTPIGLHDALHELKSAVAI